VTNLSSETASETASLSFFGPAAGTGLRLRYCVLAWLLVLTGIVSVILLLVAMLAGSRATRAFQDVNQSGSLRFRSLWVYEAAQNSKALTPGTGGWQAQMQTMSRIRGRLQGRYPQAVAASDPAWNAFAGSLRQTGRVNWQTSEAMRQAADTLTRQIEQDAAAQNRAASALLRLGLFGLLGAFAACGFPLAGLRAAEAEMRRALVGLQENRDLFLRSINAMQEGYIVIGREGLVLLCNAEAERLLGLEAAELIGQPMKRPGRRLIRENGEEFGEWQPQETTVVGLERPDQETAWFAANSAPIFHAGQTVPYAAVLTFTDISNKKKSEEALRVQEEALQRAREFQSAMLESLQAGIVACDENGTLALFNQAAREFHRLPEEPLPPEQWAERFDLFQGDGITPLATHEIPLFRAFSGEVVRDAEMVIAPEGGLSRTVLASGQAIYSRAGQKLGAVVAMHDITARRRTEQELQRLAAIVGSSEEAILASTLDGTLISWNSGAERLYGYAASEVIGQHASVLALPGQVSPVDAIIPRLLRGETIEPIEVIRHRRDGAVLNVALTFSPIHDAANAVIGVSCIARDITDWRQAEDALRESEARLRYLSNAAFEGIAVSQNGVILDANPAFVTLYGYETRDEVVGMGGSDFVVPDARALVLQKIASGEENSYESLCLRRDGSTFPAEIRGRQVLWNGLPARVTAVRDITERKKMEEYLRAGHCIVEESAARLAEAQRIARVGSWEYNLVSGQIAWSGEMFRLLGRDPDLGVPHFEEAMAHYHPEDAPGLKSLVLRAAQEGRGYELDLRGNPTAFHDGLTRWFHTTGEVSRNEAGHPVRLTGTLADMTERKNMEHALRHSEEALRAMLSSAPVILYAADKKGRVTLSEGTGLAALGLAPGEAVGRSVFEFSGGDPAVNASVRRALAGEAVSYDMKYGALSLHVELKPQRDIQGAVIGIIGVCFDITERAQSEERFRVLFEQSSNPHLLFDDTGILDCNPAAVALLHGTDKSEILALHPAVLSPEVQPDGQRSDVKCRAMDAAAYEAGYHRFEWVHRKMDGENFPVEVTLTPVILQGKPVMLVVWHDLTERKRAEQQIKDYTVILEFQKSQLEETNKELEALATTDGLTGLKNHRTFQAKLAEEHARAVRYHQPLSLLLLDVDQFKQYNDAFGHPAGDAVLISVAQALGRSARDTDTSARYGGEEFVVVLPFTDEAGAMVIAERLRTVIAGADWELRPITVSLGVCTLSLDTLTPAAMVACADHALYRSKAAGRNQATHGNPSAPLVATRPSRARRPRAVPQAAENR
jgi:diguanylate cyclase (GGDEF)-like protein/PAS domain S-box-containing protein